MTSRQKLQRISGNIRKLIFILFGSVLAVALYGYITEGVWWVTVGGDQFGQLWQAYPDMHWALAMVISPLVVCLLAGIFWLQRLLYLLSQGHFFEYNSLFCMKWLAWLALFGVSYDMAWPLVAMQVVDATLVISIRPVTLMAVLCIPVVVHLLSAAQELDQENKEII